MTERNLVVGYGNPLRGDDGLGWHAAAALAADPRLADTDVITRHQLTPELAEDIATARLAVLIDASLGDTPGCVSIREVAPAPAGRPGHTTCGRKTSSGLPMRCSAQRRRCSW